MKLSLLAPFALLAASLFGQLPDFTPPTPLIGAVVKGDLTATKKLLDAGANPNTDRFFGFTVPGLAAMQSNTEMVKLLLAAGADIESPDGTGNTLLMWAVGQETPNPALVEELLRHGANAQAKNKLGESALTWAMRRGDHATIAKLKQAGASDREMVRQAVERAIAPLQKSGPQFVKVSGCVSCHHQSVPQLAIGAARRRGFAVDEPAATHQVKTVLAMFKPVREKLASGSLNVPNPPVTLSYSLLGLHAEGYGADETTAAMAAALARVQAPNGSFPVAQVRPPMEWSTVTGTALSMRALQLYGPNDEEPVVRACHWLSSATPATNEDRAMRLMGLEWCASPSSDGAARDLLAAQRPDGGWGQLDSLETDAYATGQALAALAIAGRGHGAAFDHGIVYLLRTQLADGTWLVRTRANAVQPLKDSGFPHGRDQWISAAGTGWAALALSLSQPAAAPATTE